MSLLPSLVPNEYTTMNPIGTAKNIAYQMIAGRASKYLGLCNLNRGFEATATVT
jgi:hypothetical protein